MKHLLVIFLAFLLVACSVDEIHGDSSVNRDFSAMPKGAYAVDGESVMYFEGVTGYLAEPEDLDNAPGVILIHEWWGLNENMEETAERLASNGYRVLAVDLYEGTIATTPEQAREYRLAVVQERATANLRAADAFLRQRGSAKTASWGYCFGGGQSATFALEGVADATVVYYGSLADPLARPEAVTKPILLIFGSEDTATTADSAEQLEAVLDDTNERVELYVYEGRGHAFANPSNAGHDVNDTRDAWLRTIAFLDATLK